MRLRSRRSSISALLLLRRAQRGSSALLLVLGTLTVLIVLGVAAANAVRQELRLSRVEASAEQVSILIQSGFQRAAEELIRNPDWPTAPFTKGATPCEEKKNPPDPMWSPEPPRFCVDALPRAPFRSGTGRSNAELAAVPIRVAYQVSAREKPQYSYGWVVLEIKTAKSGKKTSTILYLVQNRTWCNFDPRAMTDPLVPPCMSGG